MTEIVVDGGFYFLEVSDVSEDMEEEGVNPEAKYIFDSKKEAIGEVKEELLDINPENILLLEVEISNGEIIAQQIPWSQIAQELIKE